MNLKDCVRFYLGKQPITYSEAMVAGGELFEKYNADDAQNTLELNGILKQKINEYGLQASYEIELGATLLAVEMNSGAILMDRPAIKDRLNTNLEKLKVLKKQIDPNENFNLRSSSQLRRLLFDQLKLPILTVDGKISTELKTLNKISKKIDSPQLENVISFKELEAENRCLETIDRFIDPDTSCIYPFLNPSGTETGRFSSSQPNLQNIKKDDFFRSIFIAKPNCRFICLDQSRIEPTVLSAIVGPGKFKMLFDGDTDCYSEIAIIMTDTLKIRITRSSAKILLLAVMYGMGPQSVAELLNVDLANGKHILQMFFETFPEIKILEQEQIDFVCKNGFA